MCKGEINAGKASNRDFKLCFNKPVTEYSRVHSLACSVAGAPPSCLPPVPAVVPPRDLVWAWAEPPLRAALQLLSQQESGGSDSCLRVAHKGEELFKGTFLLLRAAANPCWCRHNDPGFRLKMSGEGSWGAPTTSRSGAGRELTAGVDGDHWFRGSSLWLAASWDAQRASRASCLWSRGCWRRILRYAWVDLSHRPEASPHSDTADRLLAGLRAVSTNA